MSNAISALKGAQRDGVVQVSEAGLRGMVSLKADLGSAAAAIRAVTGADLPAPRQITQGAVSLAWMAPDELLILCDHGQADAMVEQLTQALADQHHLVVNVSDARAVFTLNGAGVRDVLGKLTPADLTALGPTEIRRSRLSQIPAAFWIDADRATVICFRSVAQYAFDLLSNAAQTGSDVGYHI